MSAPTAKTVGRFLHRHALEFTAEQMSDHIHCPLTLILERAKARGLVLKREGCFQVRVMWKRRGIRDMADDPLEKIIRPIVEGQIRGFLKEHPAIVDAVDWYKPRRDKAETFTNSLAKRIVRDLMCGTVQLRMRAALLQSQVDSLSISTVDDGHCGESGLLGK